MDAADIAADRQQQEITASLAKHKHDQAANAAALTTECVDCGEQIEPARQGRFPTCFQCQTDRERYQRTNGMPRRGAM